MIFRTKHKQKYLSKIPEVAVKVREKMGTELMRLIHGKKIWKIGNIEPRDSLPLIIQSDDKYWYRILRRDHDISQYRRYIKDGNLYIVFTDEWKERVNKEREKEGLGYYSYNRIRSLIILKEILEKKDDRSDLKTKLRAIQIEIFNIKQGDVKRNTIN